jgi:Putative DNA-binding domain
MSTGPADLASLQRWMHEALVFPRRVSRESIDGQLASFPNLSGAGGLAIYQRGYFLRIANCMREQFPALCYALGEALFNDFVAEYIRERPPESHTLYDLGRRFPDFLDESRPDREQPPEARETWIDFMVDLARFERQMFVMFDIPGHEGKPFATPETPDARLRLQPAFAIGVYRFPVAAYYHAVRQKQATEFPVAEPSYAALVRIEYVTRTIVLSELEYLFLKAMTHGGAVDDGIAAVARHLNAAPEDVRHSWASERGSRRRWIDGGFFVSL